MDWKLVYHAEASDEQALQIGLEQKAKEFVDKGARKELPAFANLVI